MRNAVLAISCLVGLLWLTGLLACDLAVEGRPDGGAGPMNDDGGWFGGPPDAPTPLAPSEADALGGTGTRASCLNFADDDGNGLVDCEDPSCIDPAINAACCVGSRADACCDAVAIETLESGTGCSPACLATGTTTLVPRLGQVFATGSLPVGMCPTMPRTNGFVPLGDPRAHGLLTLPSRYALTAARLVIEGRIGVAEGVTDLAAAGFGVFDEQGLGAIPRPLVAIVASASANDVRVVVGDRVVYAEPLAEDECGRSQRYRLTVRPDGTFLAERQPAQGGSWTVMLSDGRYDASPVAQVALFGQQPNPDGRPRAWVSDLTVEQHGCDVLSPSRASTPTVAAGGTHDVDGLAVFDDGAGGLDALVTSGNQIYWMDVRSDSGSLVSGTADPFAVNYQPTALWGASFERVQDVDVVVVGGAHRVFLAAGPAVGALAVYATTWNPTARTFGVTPTLVVGADDFDEGGRDAVSVDGPSALVRNSSGGEQIVLAVRVRYADGISALRLVGLSPTADLATAPPEVVGRDAAGLTTNGLLHANRSASASAFDRDEVADPQLVDLDGIVRVLYAGRRGTRWSIGMVVASPDFTHFTPVGTEPVLAPTGTGFDALGVSEPFLVRRPNEHRLYYAGSDGARRSVGLARQPVVVP
ncbi:MAG: hypothetical protein OHK0013_04800 [Sandaracinaceae bacterium]